MYIYFLSSLFIYLFQGNDMDKKERTTVAIPKYIYENFRYICLLENKKHTEKMWDVIDAYTRRKAKKHNIKLKEPA
jgi:hypothetical protein